MAFARTNNITIAFDDVGSGDDVLVFVHGHPFNRTMWDAQAAWFTKSGCRVITPDLRGYGESPPTPGKTTLDIFADDIANLLDHLRAPQAIMIGLSMGGQIVMEFCRTYSQRVRGVVLAATHHEMDSSEGRKARFAAADRILREGMAAYAEELLPRMLAPTFLASNPRTAHFVFDMMRNTSPIGAAAALRGRAERMDYAETLRRVSAPAAIIGGDTDAYTTQAQMFRMHELIQNSTFTWLKGVGHLPNLEAEVEFNGAVQALIERTREAP
jgi:pimeloyl-ACP methyl ester carboxylesterase